jgi:hypothetical protein
MLIRSWHLRIEWDRFLFATRRRRYCLEGLMSLYAVLCMASDDYVNPRHVSCVTLHAFTLLRRAYTIEQVACHIPAKSQQPNLWKRHYKAHGRQIRATEKNVLVQCGHTTVSVLGVLGRGITIRSTSCATKHTCRRSTRYASYGNKGPSQLQSERLRHVKPSTE